MVKDGASSFINIPLYFTFGVPLVCEPRAIKTFSFFFTGTSHQKYSGETPISEDISNIPKMVPRLSLPTITRASSTPSSGLLIVSIKKVSHFPCIEETSSFLLAISLSINSLFPMVPIIIAVPFNGVFPVIILGFTLDTR